MLARLVLCSGVLRKAFFSLHFSSLGNCCCPLFSCFSLFFVLFSCRTTKRNGRVFFFFFSQMMGVFFQVCCVLLIRMMRPNRGRCRVWAVMFWRLVAQFFWRSGVAESYAMYRQGMLNRFCGHICVCACRYALYERILFCLVF